MLNETPEWVKERLKSRRGRKDRQYGFAALEVGQSITIPVDEQTCTWRSFQVQASAAGSKLGRVLLTRKHKDGTFECWRAKDE